MSSPGVSTGQRLLLDLYRLLTLNDLDGRELTAALAATTAHPGSPLQRLSPLIGGLAERRQASYRAWLRRQGGAARGYPKRFGAVLDLVVAFADPLLDGQVDKLRWSAALDSWS